MSLVKDGIISPEGWQLADKIINIELLKETLETLTVEESAVFCLRLFSYIDLTRILFISEKAAREALNGR